METRNKPILFSEGNSKLEELQKLESSYPSIEKIDLYEQQLEETLEILYPSPKTREENKADFLKSKIGNDSKLIGTWAFFPWNKTLLHILNDSDLYNLRTNRNRELITLNEQTKLKDLNIGIAGLSIGSNLAFTLSHLGIRNFKLADFDKLSTSNLNRVMASLKDLGKNKATLTAQNIYETDPFSNIELFTEGINNSNLSEFLAGKTKLSVVVDSIDDFEMKIRLRDLAKKERIPVLMFTNLGDSTLIDIERYDTDPELEIFNGLLADVPNEILNSEMTDENKKKFAAKLVGIDNVPTRALGSLLKMGTELVGRPQLASTVSTSAGLAAFIVRAVALGQNCVSGRYLVHYPTAIFSNTTKEVYRGDPERQEVLKKLLQN